jgi:hypothetical protein
MIGESPAHNWTKFWTKFHSTQSRFSLTNRFHSVSGSGKVDPDPRVRRDRI